MTTRMESRRPRVARCLERMTRMPGEVAAVVAGHGDAARAMAL